MVWVTMTDGTTRRYNTVQSVDRGNDYIVFGGSKPSHEHCVAVIAKHLVARYEFKLPCKVFKKGAKIT